MWVFFAHVCCKGRLLSLTSCSLVLLTCQTDVPDVGLPSNDERGEQFVAKVSAYTQRASWSLLRLRLPIPIPVSFLSFMVLGDASSRPPHYFCRTVVETLDGPRFHVNNPIGGWHFSQRCRFPSEEYDILE
ncbi:hypothetical protein EDB85DRAFT_1949598 [Lactarius pseudohatsudake]|nr:hypothetical protein EDB85DRAFT_1949598 [Lactarius pseudohatsudake]